MDFKSFHEVVLPPEKGTGIVRKSPEGERPREEPGAARGRPGSGSAGEIVVLPGDAELPGGSPVAERSPSGDRARSSAGEPARDLHRDFIIAYDGRFLGHFSSRRRITNRTAFQKIAQRLAAKLEAFDPGRLQLYKPVPLAVEAPESIATDPDGSFSWFSEGPPEPGESC